MKSAISSLTSASKNSAVAVQTVAASSRTQAQVINSLSQQKAAKSARKADIVAAPLELYNRVCAKIDSGLTAAAGHIDSTSAGAYVESAALWVEQKKCSAYASCVNAVQAVIPGSDGSRILNGGALMMGGVFKTAGGVLLTAASIPVSTVVIGVAGIGAGTVTAFAGKSDLQQGYEEIRLGIKGDTSTVTVNEMCELLYDGNPTIYHESTGTAAMLGMELMPYVQVQYGQRTMTVKPGTVAENAARDTSDVATEGAVVEKAVEGGSEGRLIPGTEGIVTGGDSAKLGKNMMESMGLSRETNWTGYQAQHIIPAEMKNHPVLQRIGMDLDDASNGLFLRIPADDISAMSRHRGYHSTYNAFVRNQLDRIDINQNIDALQRQVYDLQQNLKHLQQSGLPLYPSQGATVDLWQRSLERIQ